MATALTVAVIGAGPLGRSIAHAAAIGGYPTILEDVLPSSLRRAEDEFRTNLARSENKGVVSGTEARSALGRLTYAESVEDAARVADFVIEALPDELESKSEIFIVLDKVCRPVTILATTTSTISVTELARVTYRADRCLGMRFVYPVDPSKQLEIVRGNETSQSTLVAATEVAKAMRRAITVVNEAIFPLELPT